MTDQAHTLGIPVFMKEDLVPSIGDENMIQDMPEEFNKVLEVRRSWQKLSMESLFVMWKQRIS